MIAQDDANKRSVLHSLRVLVTTLADTYQTHATARRLCDVAGIDTTLVTWDPIPRNLWQSIVDEAIKQNRLCALVTQARNEYPQIQNLAQFYRQHCT